jgi:hypothetical protein
MCDARGCLCRWGTTIPPTWAITSGCAIGIWREWKRLRLQLRLEAPSANLHERLAVEYQDSDYRFHLLLRQTGTTSAAIQAGVLSGILGPVWLLAWEDEVGVSGVNLTCDYNDRDLERLGRLRQEARQDRRLRTALSALRSGPRCRP